MNGDNEAAAKIDTQTQLLAQLKPFTPVLWKQVYLEKTISDLLAAGKTSDSILEDLGYRTEISIGSISNRARLFLDHRQDIDIDHGFPITDKGKELCLQQYSTALKFAQQHFPITLDSNGEQIQVANIISLGGSIVDGDPNFGIHPVGSPLSHIELRHLLSAPRKRQARREGMEMYQSGISDLDIEYSIDRRHGTYVSKKLERITKLIFDEFGVMLHFLSPEGLDIMRHNLDAGISISMEELQKQGGLEAFYRARKAE